MSNGNELRLGILCSGTTLPHWQAECIRHLLNEPGIRIAAAGITDAAEPEHNARGLRRAINGRLSELLFRKARTHEDVTSLFSGIPVVTIGHDNAGIASVHALEKHGVQAVLSLLPGAPPSPSRTSAALWWFSFEGGPIRSQGLPAIRSWMMRSAPVKVSLLSTAGHAVHGTYCEPGPLGGADMDSLLLGSAWLPVEMSRTIRRGPAGATDRTSVDGPSEEHLHGLLLHWLRMEMRHSFSIKTRPATGEWNLGIYPHPISSLLEEEGNTNVRWLTSPSPGSSRTEPFGYHHTDGQFNVLYRKNDGPGSIGTIARIRPKSDGVLKRSRTMLSTASPLGYPFVVARPDGVHVVISYPHQQRTELFRVPGSNDALDHVRTLLDKALMNPTLVEHGGRWWLFGTDLDAPDGVLRIHHAATFEGPYIPHAQDPVKMTGSGCRPAGTPFVHDGHLWRPSLDNSDQNVPAVILNRILELTPDRFQEEAVRTFTGFPGTLYGSGIRTVCDMGDFTLVDGFRPTVEVREMDGSERSSKRKAKAYEE